MIFPKKYSISYDHRKASFITQKFLNKLVFLGGTVLIFWTDENKDPSHRIAMPQTHTEIMKAFSYVLLVKFSSIRKVLTLGRDKDD